MAILTAIFAGIGVLIVLGGAYAAWSGYRTYRQGQALATASPFTEETASGEIVTVEGTVGEPVDGHSLESHYAAEPCVAYACELFTRETADRREFDESSGNVIDKRSRTEEDAIPFGVEGNGQRIRVEAPDADLRWSGSDFEEVSGGTVIRNLLSLRAFFDLLSLLTGGGRKRRRYYEARLHPGDEVIVTGTVRRNGDEVSIGRATGVPLVATTNPRRSMAGEYRSKGTSGVGWGVILVAAGCGLLYALAGTL